jgi:hypothetical protein
MFSKENYFKTFSRTTGPGKLKLTQNLFDIVQSTLPTAIGQTVFTCVYIGKIILKSSFKNQWAKGAEHSAKSYLRGSGGAKGNEMLIYWKKVYIWARLTQVNNVAHRPFVLFFCLFVFCHYVFAVCLIIICLLSVGREGLLHWT